jgi:hypothetical protein
MLVAERDDAALAEAALALAGNPARLAVMGAAGSAAVRAGFEQRAQVRALEGFYAGIA